MKKLIIIVSLILIGGGIWLYPYFNKPDMEVLANEMYQELGITEVVCEKYETPDEYYRYHIDCIAKIKVGGKCKQATYMVKDRKWTCNNE